jgi:hypothetical protein
VRGPARRRLPRGLAALLCGLAFLCGSALAQPAGRTILFRWFDAEGKVHYTDNFNSIPERSRATAVQGAFVEEADAVYPARGAHAGAAKPLSGKLDLLGETHSEENGYLHIEGRVRNGFGNAISSITAKVSFFDRSETFLRAESAVVDPMELQPGDEGTYRLVVRSAPDVASYKTEMLWK